MSGLPLALGAVALLALGARSGSLGSRAVTGISLDTSKIFLQPEHALDEYPTFVGLRNPRRDAVQHLDDAVWRARRFVGRRDPDRMKGADLVQKVREDAGMRWLRVAGRILDADTFESHVLAGFHEDGAYAKIHAGRKRAVRDLYAELRRPGVLSIVPALHYGQPIGVDLTEDGDRIGTWRAQHEPSMRASYCDADVQALCERAGVGDVPTYSVPAAWLDAPFHGNGLGRLMYEHGMATMARGAPAIFVPHRCAGVGDTSPDAERVWKALARTMAHEGRAVLWMPAGAA